MRACTTRAVRCEIWVRGAVEGVDAVLVSRCSTRASSLGAAARPRTSLCSTLSRFLLFPSVSIAPIASRDAHVPHIQQGCTTGTHSAEAPKPAVARSAGVSSFKEPVPAPLSNGSAAAAPVQPPPRPTAPRTPPKPTVYVEEEDDLTVLVAPGAKCLRTGCNHTFVSDEVSRTGNGSDAECVYHPAPVSRPSLFAGNRFPDTSLAAPFPRRKQGV